MVKVGFLHPAIDSCALESPSSLLARSSTTTHTRHTHPLLTSARRLQLPCPPPPPQVGLYIPQDYNSAYGLLRALVRDGDDFEDVRVGGRASWG